MRSSEDGSRQTHPGQAPGNKMDTHYRRRRSKGIRLAAVVILLCLIAQMITLEDLHSFVTGTSITKTSQFKTNSINTNNNETETATVDSDRFERILWPQLQRKLCPAGTPRLSLGEKLFQMARSEYGLNVKKRHSRALLKTFYDNTHGSTLILNNNDPNDSLLYVRIWKCANNQIRDYLETFFNQHPAQKSKLDIVRERMVAKSIKINGGETRKKKKHKTNVARNSETNSSKANGTGNYTYMELEGRDFFGLFNTNRHGKKVSARSANITASGNEDKPFFRYRSIPHEKPCVFTVMRDPISHFLSGYNEIEYRTLVHKIKVVNKQKIDGKPSYMDISHSDQDGRERRFETFVRNLIEEHPLFYHHWLYSHVFPLARMLHPLKKMKLLPTLEESPQQWILPSVANLSQSLPQFLAERCPKFVENYAPNSTSSLPRLKVSKNGLHASSKDELGTYQAAKDVWEKNDHVARSLCHLHAFDYGCFYGSAVPSGVTSLGVGDIPQTCKEVYASDFFRETVHSVLK